MRLWMEAKVDGYFQFCRNFVLLIGEKFPSLRRRHRISPGDKKPRITRGNSSSRTKSWPHTQSAVRLGLVESYNEGATKDFRDIRRHHTELQDYNDSRLEGNHLVGVRVNNLHFQNDFGPIQLKFGTQGMDFQYVNEGEGELYHPTGK
ncbi:hypothetical protein ACFE04_016264 [Oxalis oulophora]